MGKGASALTEAEFIEEVAKRLDGGISKANVRDVVKAIKAEAIDCLSNGYKVSLTGFATFTPVAKKGRKKGTEVRNPFDGTSKKLRADEPDKFKVKAKVSSSVLKEFPTARTQDGQKLIKQLLPAKKR